MLTLYHAPQSRSSRIVWALEELGVEYRLQLTDIPRMDGGGAPDPANPHPDKKVPALDHDGELVTESVAILLYLTDTFPAARLGPLPGEPGRGAYLTWLAWYAGVLEPVLVLELSGLAGNPAIERTFRNGDAARRRIAAALETGPYILGERFSTVDILLVNLAQFARGALPAGEPVDSWLERCTARPALERARARDAG